MNNYRLLSVLFLLSLAPWSVAQAEKKLNFPDGDAAWQVRIDHNELEMPDGAEAAAQGKVWALEHDIVRTGDARRDTIRWSNGKTTESWWYYGKPKVYMEETPLSGRTFFVAPNETVINKLMDESFFKWVANAPMAGEEKIGGEECIIYADTIQHDQVEMKMKAWVEKETKVPVKIQINNTIYHYTFSDPPTSKLILPKKLVDKVKRARAVAGLE